MSPSNLISNVNIIKQPETKFMINVMQDQFEEEKNNSKFNLPFCPSKSIGLWLISSKCILPITINFISVFL